MALKDTFLIKEQHALPPDQVKQIWMQVLELGKVYVRVGTGTEEESTAHVYIETEGGRDVEFLIDLDGDWNVVGLRSANW